ncbi:DUF397 domain-containing protein [Salinifilum ghardaiensis]
MSGIKPTHWRKPERSGSNGGNCVEVGRVGGGAAVRDTKNRAAGHFTTSRAQWQAFIAALKTDRFT